jgi:hypothetical protein
VESALGHFFQHVVAADRLDLVFFGFLAVIFIVMFGLVVLAMGRGVMAMRLSLMHVVILVMLFVMMMVMVIMMSFDTVVVCRLSSGGDGSRRSHRKMAIRGIRRVMAIVMGVVLVMMIVMIVCVFAAVIVMVLGVVIADLNFERLASGGRLSGLRRIEWRVFDDGALHAITMTPAARTAVTRAASAGAILGLFLGFAMRALVGLDQGLTVGNGNLVVVRMNFAEGKEAVPVAAVFDEGGLQ